MRLLGLLLLAGSLAAQTLAAQTIGARIDKILAGAPAAQQALWGIRVVDLQTGKTVYSRNGDQFFIPASNTKLFSTAFALTRLGPDYRFRTIITAPAKLDATGALAELRFVGGGDPNLSGREIPYRYDGENADPLRHVEAFAQQLVDAGLRTVSGDIIGDDSAYAGVRYPDGWALDDPVFDYGAPVSALFVNDGMFVIRANPTEEGHPPSIEYSPAVRGMVIHNRAATGATTKLRFARLPGSNELTIAGTVARPAEAYLGMEEPALFAAEALRDALLKRGVQIGGVARVEHSPAPGVTLLTHDSQPLIEDLKVINKESLNLHAEIVLLEAGRVRSGIGTREAALGELSAFLREIGIPEGQYTFRDGSGLSRQTLVTPQAITQLLVHMYNSPHRDAWIGTLPIGRTDGTLAKRFAGLPRGKQVYAKTGSISHVNALSGYAGRYAFSILVNNANAPAALIRRIMDQIAVTLVPAAPVRSSTHPVPISGRARTAPAF